jgi:hypothetical protein
MYVLLFLLLEASTLREKNAVKEASHCKSQNKIHLDSKKGLMQQKTEKGKLIFDYFSEF